MTFYPPRIHARFISPQFAGSLPEANAAGTGVSFECGCFVRISLVIENESKTIRQARFQSNGCGYMIAAADSAAQMLCGSRLTDLHGMSGDETGPGGELEEFPAERRQCGAIVAAAVKDALAGYRTRILDEFRGEKALICTCFGVSEETVEAYIRQHSPSTVDQITEACRAGSGCGSCRMLIREILDQHSGVPETFL